MSNRGSSSVAGAIILVLMFVVGFLFGWVAYKYTAQGSIPELHDNLAKEITIYDMDYNTSLICVFLKSSKTPMMSSLESLQFTPKLVEYDVSEWGWYIGRDPDAYMNIWGPANDGKTYLIEISKTSGNTLKVTCPEGTFMLEENAYLSMIVTVG